MSDRMRMNDAMDEVFNQRHAPRQLDDSARNQLAELVGEADEPCYYCDEPVRPATRGGLGGFESYWEFTVDEDGEIPCHEDCHQNAYEAHLERKAEERAQDRLHGWL